MTEQLHADETAGAAMTPAQALGAKLAAAREAAEMSRGDMVTRLCMAPRQVEALENGQFDKLPEPVYVHAFIRGYANAVGIDYKPLVAEYDAAVGLKGPVFMSNALDMGSLDSRSETVFESSYSRPKLLWAAGAAAVVLVAGLAGLAWTYSSSLPFFNRGGQVQVADAKKAKPAKPEAPKAVEPAAPKAAPAAELPPPPPAGEPVVQPQAAAGTAVPAAPAAAEAAKPAEEKKAEANVVMPPPKGRNIFEVTALESSWVRIADSRDVTLLNQTIDAGQTVAIGSDLGLTVTIGRSTAVQLKHNGRQVNLKRYSRPSGVARYTVK